MSETAAPYLPSQPYAVAVPEVGDFLFRRRTLRDELAINAAAQRLVGGEEGVSSALYNLAYMVATLDALTVKAPGGWDLLNADPEEPEVFRRIGAVFDALRAAEGRFRAAGAARLQGTGADPGSVG